MCWYYKCYRVSRKKVYLFLMMFTETWASLILNFMFILILFIVFHNFLPSEKLFPFLTVTIHKLVVSSSYSLCSRRSSFTSYWILRPEACLILVVLLLHLHVTGWKYLLISFSRAGWWGWGWSWATRPAVRVGYLNTGLIAIFWRTHFLSPALNL